MRPIALDDAGDMIAVIEANREHLVPWMPWARDSDPGSTRLFVAAKVRQMQVDEGAQFVIVRDDRIIGTIGLLPIDWMNSATSVGYWLAADAQGQGIMTAALRAVARWIFDDLGLHRIQLRAAPENTRSQAVAERCGFVFEGIAREAELAGDGYRDLRQYALLASD